MSSIIVKFQEQGQFATDNGALGQGAKKRLNDFIAGNDSPEIIWTEFDDPGIKGAFANEANTILLSNKLKDDPDKALQVALEEIGHWVDSANTTDTAGDEGNAFANQILGIENERYRVNGIDKQYGLVEIDGEQYVGELAHSRMSVSSIEITDPTTIKVIFTENITSTEASLDTFFKIYDGASIIQGNYTSETSSETSQHFQQVQSTDINNNELTLKFSSDFGVSFDTLPITTQLRYKDTDTSDTIGIEGEEGLVIDSEGFGSEDNNQWAINAPTIYTATNTSYTSTPEWIDQVIPTLNVDTNTISIYSSEILDDTAAQANLEVSFFKSNCMKQQHLKRHL